MAIVQISKIIHRVGANVDLPQLDTGELGFSTDTRQLFIGNDPVLYPPAYVNATTQTEILTEASVIDFSRLANSSNTTMSLSSVDSGQLLGIANVGNVMTVKNVGGNVGGLINLGNVSNLKITGEAFNGAVLQTDGTGNLSWTTNGVLLYAIANISQANPAVVTTQGTHLFGTGTEVTIYDVFNGTAGMLQLLTAGVGGTNKFYVKRLTNTTFSLYTNSTVTTGVDSTLFDPAVPNIGNALGTIAATGSASAGGANTQIQFNDSSGFMGSANLTFNKSTNNLNVTGNIILNTHSFISNVGGVTVTNISNGNISTAGRLTTANLSVTANATVAGTLSAGNMSTGGNVSAAGRLTGQNLSLSANATVTGNLSANFASLSQSLSVSANISAGNLSTTGNITASGNLSANFATVLQNMAITGNLEVGNLNVLDTVTASNSYVENNYMTYGANSWQMFANADGIFMTNSVTGNTYQLDMTQV